MLIKQEGIDVNYYEPAKMNKVFAFVTAVSKLALRLQNNPLQTCQLFAVGAATALHMAAFNGSLGSVELLLQAKANVVSAAHPLKMTPLHVAAFAGHREMCVRLLEGSLTVLLARLKHHALGLDIEAKLGHGLRLGAREAHRLELRPTRVQHLRGPGRAQGTAACHHTIIVGLL